MPVDWAMAISAAGNAIKLTNDLRGINKEVSAAEYKLKIADLTSTLADLKITLTDAREEVRERDKKIEELEEKLKWKSDNTVIYQGFRFRASPDGSPLGLPYCPTCEQKERIFVRLSYAHRPGRGKECSNCDSHFDPAPAFSEDG